MQISFIVGFLEGHFPRILCVSAGVLNSCFDPPDLYELCMNPGRYGEQLAVCSQIGGRFCFGAVITAASCLLPLSDVKFPHCLREAKGHKWQLTYTHYKFCNVKSCVLWMCHFPLCSHKDFFQERSFVILSLVSSWFRLLHHFSSFR